jgi:hypothetical protein
MARAARQRPINRLSRLQATDFNIRFHGSEVTRKTLGVEPICDGACILNAYVSVEIDRVELAAVSLEPGLGFIHVRT